MCLGEWAGLDGIGTQAPFGVMTGPGDGNKEGCVLPFKYLSIVSGGREQDCLVALAQPGALQTQFLA